MQAGNVMGVGRFIPNHQSPDSVTGRSDNITQFWMVGGTVVEIRGWIPKTGHVES